LTLPLTVVAPEACPRFIISLDWNNAADLDLHVVIPNGVEIFNRNPTEYQRPSVSTGRYCQMRPSMAVISIRTRTNTA